MKKIFLGIIFSFFLICSSSFAETVYFKNGQTSKGPLLDKNSSYVIISEGGIPQKYYMDQVDHIEEDPKVEIPSNINVDTTQFPGITKEKADLIISLIEANGTRANLEQNFAQTLAQTPEDRKEEMKALLNIGEIVKLLVPIYDKYYTEEDLNQLIQFYTSSVGKKVFEVTPQIVQETLQATISYFQQNSKGTSLQQ